MRAQAVSGPTPSRSATPGRRPSTSTSARSARRSTTSAAPGRLRSTAAERRELEIRDLRWLAPPRAALEAAIQVRHRGAPIAASIRFEADRATAVLAEPTVAAPGQAAVVYDADRVLAGGWLC